MVSVYPNPPPDRDFSHFYGFHMGGDTMKSRSEFETRPFGSGGSGLDDPNKKIRKPYTTTKSRESWSEQEHDKFLEALHLFDRDWKKIEAFVGSKTVIQIRSHAQKYFLKVQKSGTSEHVPPPRPKRKASHPYPHKAPKKAVSQATCPLQSSAALVERGYGVGCDSPWTYNVVPTGCLSKIPKDDIGLANNYSSSSNESTPRVGKSNGTYCEVKQCNNRARVMPDFAQVYRFLGSVFDPSARDHLQRLKKLDPIDVETVLMLMKNLTVNLESPEFENHRKLLASYNSGIESDDVRSTIQSG